MILDIRHTYAVRSPEQQAVLREAHEETGLVCEFIEDRPFDIDCLFIPASRNCQPAARRSPISTLTTTR